MTSECLHKIELTAEQERVVSIVSGRHLVLAPPGSGKTEMLSQRILRAVRAGVDPSRMLCATFTNRAAFEMRSRVGADAGNVVLPDVGNLHHFCLRFLRSVGRLAPTRHVLDEVEQLGFIKEAVDIFRKEAQAVGPEQSVANGALDMLDEYCATCAKNDKSPYVGILSAVLISHQRRIGIPGRFLRKMSPEMIALDGEGVIRSLAKTYARLKRSFDNVDFDDLINETYLYLENNPISDERRFDWVQIDEVQDLNSLQWRIVCGLTSSRAVSVYFGDSEQAIFSFLGASMEGFREAVRGCERHYFKTNFRTTPLLLEILMRYSLDALNSDWQFLPSPVDVRRENGCVAVSGSTDRAEVLKCVRGLLDGGVAQTVAILVRRNREADELEAEVKEMGYRYAKVSGVDLFSLAPMKDFLAFVTVLISGASRMDWARLFRRFARGLPTSAQSRYFVRAMFAVRFDPELLFKDAYAMPLFLSPWNRRSTWAWRNNQRLSSFRKTLIASVVKGRRLLDGPALFRPLFDLFSRLALDGGTRYSLRELWPEQGGPRDECDEEQRVEAVAHARERIEKFLRYVDMIYAHEDRTLREILESDWERFRTLKEPDILVGDERIVLSTVHKAKGRQFDAVVIPNVSDVLLGADGEEGEAERLLYVGMSRAKRHLLMFGWPESAVYCRLKPCFRQKYINYYLRKASGVDVSEDWLSRWERLAALNADSRYKDDVVDEGLVAPECTVVRMALLVLRHHPDAAIRRQKFLEMADSSRRDMDETAAVLVGCLESCQIVDPEALRHVRALAWRCNRQSVWGAVMRYYQCIVHMDVNRTDAMDCLHDGLYSAFPGIRVYAAQCLADCGEAQWGNLVKGSARDFIRLGDVSAPRHEEAVRQIARKAESVGQDAYARRLREIIFARSKTVNN